MKLTIFFKWKIMEIELQIDIYMFKIFLVPKIALKLSSESFYLKKKDQNKMQDKDILFTKKINLN